MSPLDKRGSRWGEWAIPAWGMGVCRPRKRFPIPSVYPVLADHYNSHRFSPFRYPTAARPRWSPWAQPETQPVWEGRNAHWQARPHQYSHHPTPHDDPLVHLCFRSAPGRPSEFSHPWRVVVCGRYGCRTLSRYRRRPGRWLGDRPEVGAFCVLRHGQGRIRGKAAGHRRPLSAR